MKRQLAKMKTLPSGVAEKAGKIHMDTIMEQMIEQPVRGEVPIR